MGLFKPDFYRSFAIGFAFGAALIAWQMGPEARGDIVPQVHAATLAFTG